MISFTHGAESITLEPGACWTRAPQGETYRDLPAKDLLKMVEEIKSGAPWKNAVKRHQSRKNPWLSRVVTDPARDLFFRQHPLTAGSRVLDVGAGWGQIAVPLARTCQLTALEPTPERAAFIRAVAHQEEVTARMYFLQADFFDVDFVTQFDAVCSIGVLERVGEFRPGNPHDVQIEFLSRIRKLLVRGGKLVIGIENRLGLKYVLGAPDDHIGVPGVAVYDAEFATRKWKEGHRRELRSFTYTHRELTDLLACAGLTNVQFFAALPDYKVPEVILPLGSKLEEYFACGGFVPEHDGSSGRMLGFQAELQSHYRSLARMGIASNFVPSFFVVALKD